MPDTNQPTDEARAARRDRYAAAMAKRDGDTWPTAYENDEADYRRRADAAMAVADTELARAQAEAHQYRTALQGVARAAASPSVPADQTALRDRYAAAIREFFGDLPYVAVLLERCTDAVMAVADAEQASLRRERDLAVAHDRQPYPTAWAYEQACTALHTHRERADAVEEQRRALAIVLGLDADAAWDTIRAQAGELAAGVGRAAEGRPRCPHCQLPHDLDPASGIPAVCASIRAQIADADRLHDEDDHRLCVAYNCAVARERFRAATEQPATVSQPDGEA
ncbi:hypothetical protein [Streptomyces sp. NPDC047990]|uniref:hypothetical protein n=1 Tax=Streptomyces sp. NPDC047990 TaxID=3365496 RepID=UPI003717256F